MTDGHHCTVGIYRYSRILVDLYTLFKKELRLSW